MSDCPTEEQLVQLIEQRLPQPLLAEVSQHVQQCSTCSMVLTMLGDGHAREAAIASASLGAPTPSADTNKRPELPFATGEETLLIGQHVDGYRIERELGRGGMGVVYEALHEQIRRRAAIKIMRLRALPDRKLAHRFLTEARASNAVHHPGIVAVFGMGQLPSGDPYIVMEYLQGQSLRDRLCQQEKLAWPIAVRLTRQLADALTAAHDHGVIHRDLKPDNIMIVPDPAVVGGERVKILDFGLAKFVNEPPVSDSLHTRSGAILGTPIYIAPEQIGSGATAGGAADVYSLGVVLFELLAGRPPFIAATAAEVYAKHLRDEPPRLSTLLPELPNALSELVASMLAKQPAARPDMRHVAQALAMLDAGELPPAARPMRRSAGRVRTLLFRGGVLAATLGLIATSWLIVSRNQRQSRALALPGGTFTMGSSPEEVDAAFVWCQRLVGDGCRREQFQRELPSRRIQLSPFFLDETEVTTQSFVAWLNRLPKPKLRVEAERLVFLENKEILDLYPTFSHFGVTHAGGQFSSMAGYEHKPITQVTWDGALAYCEAQAMRLPTEAEWEYAARSAQGFRFPWGQQEPTCEGVVFARLPTYACGHLNAGMADVGTAKQDRSLQGVHDLAGNVAEWVFDSYLEHYPPCEEPCRDPRQQAPADSGEELHIVRGGDWNAAAPLSRAAWRGRLAHNHAKGNVGFRCAMSRK